MSNIEQRIVCVTYTGTNLMTDADNNIYYVCHAPRYYPGQVLVLQRDLDSPEYRDESATALDPASTSLGWWTVVEDE